jgi:CTP:molybdopterin cytidylyltransferase MocA
LTLEPLPVVVCAAGQSTRMGVAKALLRCGGQTFVERILRTCDACGLTPVVVRRPDQRSLETELSRLGEKGLQIRQALNPHPDSEMLDSFRVGLEALEVPPTGRGVLTWPVDVPAVRPDTVLALKASALANPQVLVAPRHQGRSGHPAYMPPAVVSALLTRTFSDPAPEGLRSVAASCGVEDLALELDDPAVVLNVNTPEDLERLRRLLRQRSDNGRGRDA